MGNIVKGGVHALGRGVGFSKVALGSESYTRFQNLIFWCSSRSRLQDSENNYTILGCSLCVIKVGCVYCRYVFNVGM